MNASELRIGNFIKYNGKVYQIDSIAEVFPTLNTTEFGIGVVDWNNINPIPLTEEWLINLGFFVSDLLIAKNGIALSSDFSIPFYDSTGNIVRVLYLKYVHQLQNFYFAITGEELCVK